MMPKANAWPGSSIPTTIRRLGLRRHRHHTYTWDYRNRLTAVSTHRRLRPTTRPARPSSVVSYVYDYANRLIGRTLDADGTVGTGDIHETVYSYDGNQIVLQFDKTYANGSATDLTATDLSHRYVWDSQAVDHLFADEDVSETELLYTLTDHQGSVRDLASYDSQTGVTTIANHRVYDAYGNLQSETNSAVDSLFGYTCRPYDEATGLQNNLHRWYDASTGRWLSQDPIGFAAGDANVYRYCGNSPITYADPTGLQVAASAGGVIPSAGPPILPPAGSYFPFGTPYEPQYPSIIPPNWPNIDGVEPPIIPPPGGFWPPILPPQWPPIPIDSIIPQDWPRLPPPGWGGSDNGMSIQFDPEIFIISPLPIYYGPRSLPELCPQNKPDWWESRIQSLLPISPWPNRPDYMPPGIPDVDKGTPGSNPGLQGGYQNSWPFEIPGGWIQGKIETGLGPSGPSDLNKPNLVPWGIRITIPTTPPPKK